MVVQGQVLLPNNLHQNPPSPARSELAVEDLLPGAKIELALGDGDDQIAAHDLALHVGVGVVFAGAVMVVLGGRCVWRQLLQPQVIVAVQPAKMTLSDTPGWASPARAMLPGQKKAGPVPLRHVGAGSDIGVFTTRLSVRIQRN